MMNQIIWDVQLGPSVAKIIEMTKKIVKENKNACDILVT